MLNPALPFVVALAGPKLSYGYLTRNDCAIIMAMRNPAPSNGLSKRPMGFSLSYGSSADDSVSYGRVAKAA